MVDGLDRRIDTVLYCRRQKQGVRLYTYDIRAQSGVGHWVAVSDWRWLCSRWVTVRDHTHWCVWQSSPHRLWRAAAGKRWGLEQKRDDAIQRRTLSFCCGLFQPTHLLPGKPTSRECAILLVLESD